MINKLQKVKEALEFLSKFETVSGDAMKRLNPHSRVNLNSTAHWLVSPTMAAHELRKKLADCKEALAELTEFMERLDSEKLQKEVGDAIKFETPLVCDEERDIVAEMVIDMIKGGYSE